MKYVLLFALLLGFTFVIKGQDTLTTAQLEELVRTNPDSAEAWYRLGRSKFSNRGNDEAESAFKKAIEIKADYAEAHFALGSWYLRKRGCGLIILSQSAIQESRLKQSKAVESLERAVELKPIYPAAFVRLGEAYSRLDRIQESAVAYRKAVDQGANHVLVLLDLARIEAKLNRNIAAVEVYRLAIEASRRTPNRQKDEWEKSIDHLFFKLAYSNLAHLYWSLERFDEARSTYEEIVRLGIDETDTHYRLGLSFVKMRDKTLAQREYEKMRELAARERDDWSRRSIKKDARDLLRQIKKL